MLLVALGLGALVALAPTVDGRSFGGFLAHRFVCAVKGGCDDGDAELAAAYGERATPRCFASTRRTSSTSAVSGSCRSISALPQPRLRRRAGRS